MLLNGFQNFNVRMPLKEEIEHSHKDFILIVYTSVYEYGFVESPYTWYVFNNLREFVINLDRVYTNTRVEVLYGG